MLKAPDNLPEGVVSIRAARVSGDGIKSTQGATRTCFNPRRSGERRFLPVPGIGSVNVFQSAPLG